MYYMLNVQPVLSLCRKHPLTRVDRSVPQRVGRSVPQRVDRSVPQRVGRSVPQRVDRPVPKRVDRSVPQRVANVSLWLPSLVFLCRTPLTSLQVNPVTNSKPQFSSVQNEIYALRKAHMRSTPSLRSFPSVAFETVPMFVLSRKIV